MKKFIKITGYLLIIIGAISMLAPFIWMISVSFMTDFQIFSVPVKIIPNPLILDNYINVFSKLPITRFFLNSLFVAVTTTVFQVIFSSLAGYAFARINFKGKDLLFFIFIVTMMIPPQVNIIPLFFLFFELHLIDTFPALILPGIFGGMGVFLMRQWFKSVSTEIEDAARIDGCNLFEIFFKIALPVSMPAIVTLGLFTFVTTWNSFMWPLIVTNSLRVTTLPVAIAQFKGSFRELIQWGDLMACSVVLSVPVIIIFLAGQKYFINDILAGSLKE